MTLSLLQMPCNSLNEQAGLFHKHDAQVKWREFTNYYLEQEKSCRDLFASLKFVQERARFFASHPEEIPTKLDPAIEAQFRSRHKLYRRQLFELITDAKLGV